MLAVSAQQRVLWLAGRWTPRKNGRVVTVTVVPVTSNISRIRPFQVLREAGMVGLRVDSKAQAGQVRSVSVERLGRPIGRLPPFVMAQLEDALRLDLAL